jgi:amidase
MVASLFRRSARGEKMNRRDFLGVSVAAALAASRAGQAGQAASVADPGPGQTSLAASFDPTEKSLTELGAALQSGTATAASLTSSYLARIETLDRAGPSLNAVIATNPQALSIARDLDAERRAGRSRGPLHGIPILLKDNIETLDPLPTTAGSLALADAYHDADAPLVARLRSSGAVILGKANLSEWANFRSAHSVSGWSGVGGQTLNPYATRFNPSGSSSGPAAAAAASLCAGAIGTETDGSILQPSSCCGLVGFKPTVGVVSGAGIVPLSPRQDTAGPMTRSVLDAVLLLETIAEGRYENRPTRATLDGFRVRGLRIGVLPPSPSAHPEVLKRWTEWSRPLATEGAVLVDMESPKTFAQMGDIESTVLLWEFKAAINNYLRSLPARVASRTLADLIAFNRLHADKEMVLFGQDLFEDADKLGALTSPVYLKARDHLMTLADTNGLAHLFNKYRVDVLLAAGGGPAEPIDPVWGDRTDGGGSPSIASAAAVAGYPSVTVPAGFVRGLPVGVVLVAPRNHDGMLLQVAHAYERATLARRPPTYVSG